MLLGAATAVVLPGARITITPQALPIDPAGHSIVLTATQETVSESITRSGLPTGKRIDRLAARGVVVFSNWNTVSVAAPIGTVVAAGEIDFETTEEVVVPAGRLGPGLTVIPGQAQAPVQAIEPGSAGNVGAAAIDAVASQPTRSYLRGFANNDQRLVTNPQPTADGAETVVTLVSAEDVDAVRTELRAAVAERARTEIGARPDRIYAPLEDGDLEIQVEVPEGLVGREGGEPFELTASYRATLRYVPLDHVEAAARERFAGSSLPEGYELLDEATTVRFGERRLQDGQIMVEVAVTGQAAPAVDLNALRPQLAGMTSEAAAALLSRYGDVEVSFWPGWVTTIPDFEWRIDLQTTSVRRLQ